MDSYTVMLVVDEVSPVQRFQIPKRTVRRAVQVAAAFALLLLIGLWDYTRVRADNAELDDLRIEVVEQREQIQNFEKTLGQTNEELGRVRELERKVRIIANLPGASGVGGEGVTEIAPVPVGVPIDATLAPPTDQPVPTHPDEVEPPSDDAAAADPADEEVELQRLALEGLSSEGARHVDELSHAARRLAASAASRGNALDELLAQLDDKRNRLMSMPSVWPTHGWLTSRFGARISPFTGRRQMHAGIDIAARAGTPITAPARGRVVSLGSHGPLGNSVTIDHGFGVKTFYGHTSHVFVHVGDRVERGQKIAAVGSTGRSTGPHLHYAIHVNGKSRDPLDYIFD